MSALTRPSPAWALLFLWGLSFSFACHLSGQKTGGGGGDAFWGQILSSSRAGFSQDFYQRADLYFHNGVGFTRAPSPLKFDPYRTLLDRISPEIVHHRAQQDIKEIMPWLRLTTLLNPTHIEAFLVTAFWLTEEAQRPDLAQRVLHEAILANPRDYRLYLGRAKLQIRTKNYAQAARSLDIGLSLWPGHTDLDQDDLQIDHASLLTYRALLWEINGENGKAADALENVLHLYPTRQHLRERISDLRSGKRSAISALQLSDHMLRQRPADDHHGHDHGLDHGHDH